MTEEKPAREWWIQFTGNLQEETFVYRPGEVESDRHGLVPVIERSAYEKLERELRAEIERQEKGRIVALQAVHEGDGREENWRVVHQKLKAERDELRRELAEARTLLSNVTVNRNDWANSAGAYMRERDRLKQELELEKRGTYIVICEKTRVWALVEAAEAKLKTAREALKDYISEFPNVWKIRYDAAQAKLTIMNNALTQIENNPTMSSNPDLPRNLHNWVEWAKGCARKALEEIGDE